MNKALFKFILFFLVYNLSFAQTASLTKKQKITGVFNKLVAAYGSSKSAPKLKITTTSKQRIPAVYFAAPIPTISLDKNVILICDQFGKDSENALSIIISHELAHYYNDHTFCTDFAFAVRKKENDFSNKLKALTKTEKLAIETEADHKGLFYACIAGFKPFGVYPKLLGKIYKFYDISDSDNGYPTINERKSINVQAQQKVSELYVIFLEGIKAINKGNYDLAISNFEYLNNFFPSRENYNNLGLSRALKALKYKPLTRAAYKNPKRFEYPFGIDNESRLNHINIQRSLDEDSFKLMINLLKKAQKDFEKAISLDDSYVQSYINLACVFDLLGNPEAAIGKIKELSVQLRVHDNVKRITAIAYHNMGLISKANFLWEELGL